MAYTDFANVIAPINWDQAQSGIIIGSGSGGGNLTSVQALYTHDLSDFWDGSKYDFEDGVGAFDAMIVLVSQELFDTTEIYIDQEPSSSDGPAVTLYGTDGEILSGFDTVGDEFSDRELISGDRYVYRMGSPPPLISTGVKAIRMTGFMDFPQGRAKFAYGLYGPGPSIQTQFWTGFEGRQDQWPFKNRLTELF